MIYHKCFISLAVYQFDLDKSKAEKKNVSWRYQAINVFSVHAVVETLQKVTMSSYRWTKNHVNDFFYNCRSVFYFYFQRSNANQGYINIWNGKEKLKQWLAFFGSVPYPIYSEIFNFVENSFVNLTYTFFSSKFSLSSQKINVLYSATLNISLGHKRFYQFTHKQKKRFYL